MSNSLGFQIEVSYVADIYTSFETVYAFNQFDEFGDILSIKRAKNEDNVSFKRRLQNAASYLSNCSYRGLINGITRELGLSLFHAISINPKTNGSQSFIASDPYIKFDGAYLYLYSDYENSELACTIDRFQPGGNYEHLHSLVSLVNQTDSFEASILSGVDSYTKSMTILNQSNRENIRLEIIPQSTKFRLNKKFISRGKCFFSNRRTFKTEVASENEVSSSGKYYIDYSKGIVTVYNTPIKNEYVRYEYTVYPFKAIASPVVLHDLNQETFKIKMFEQILQDDGTYVHGLPTELGIDIINELLSVTPMYFGI